MTYLKLDVVCCSSSASMLKVLCNLKCFSVKHNFKAWLTELLWPFNRFELVWPFFVRRPRLLWCFCMQNCRSLDVFFIAPFCENLRDCYAWISRESSNYRNIQTSLSGTDKHATLKVTEITFVPHSDGWCEHYLKLLAHIGIILCNSLLLRI